MLTCCDFVPYPVIAYSTMDDETICSHVKSPLSDTTQSMGTFVGLQPKELSYVFGGCLVLLYIVASILYWKKERMRKKSQKKWEGRVTEHTGEEVTDTSHPSEVRIVSPTVLLKGHKDNVSAACLSRDGTLFASASLDRSVHCFRTFDIDTCKTTPYFASCPTAYDYLSCMAFADDDHSYVVGTSAGSQAIHFFEISGLLSEKLSIKHLDQDIATDHRDRIIFVAMKSSLRVVITASVKTMVQVHALNGSKVATFETKQMMLNSGFSMRSLPLFAIASQMSDIKVYSLLPSKGAASHRVGRDEPYRQLCHLSGHASSILACCESGESAGVILSLSTDGMLKLWDINVRHEVEEAPLRLGSWSIPSLVQKAIKDAVLDGQIPPILLDWHSATGLVLVAAGPLVYCWDLETATIRHCCRTVPPRLIQSAQFVNMNMNMQNSPCKRGGKSWQILVGAEDKWLQLYRGTMDEA